MVVKGEGPLPILQYTYLHIYIYIFVVTYIYIKTLQIAMEINEIPKSLVYQARNDHAYLSACGAELTKIHHVVMHMPKGNR